MVGEGAQALDKRANLNKAPVFVLKGPNRPSSQALLSKLRHPRGVTGDQTRGILVSKNTTIVQYCTVGNNQRKGAV